MSALESFNLTDPSIGGPLPQIPVLPDSNAEENFTVGELLKIRKTKKHGRVANMNMYEMLVRWEGFDSDGDTWEPLENLMSDVSQMVDDFY